MRLDTALSALALTVSVSFEPAGDLTTLFGLMVVTLELVDVASDLRVLISKLILLNLDAAGVCLRNRNGCLEVRLLVNAAHHMTRFQKVVRSLQFRRTHLTSCRRGHTPHARQLFVLQGGGRLRTESC